MNDERQKKIFSNNLNRLLELHDMKQNQLAKSLKINTQTINTWCTGSALPRMGKIQMIADFFHVKKSELIEEKTLKKEVSIEAYPLTTQRIPLLGSIACGYATDPGDSFRDEYIEIQTTKTVNADYALTASGDSMTGSHIYDGDIVLIHQQPDVNDGEIAAVLIDDETTLKIIDRSIPGYLLLKPDNAKFKTIAINIGKMEQEERNIRILGKAIAVQHLL